MDSDEIDKMCELSMKLMELEREGIRLASFLIAGAWAAFFAGGSTWLLLLFCVLSFLSLIASSWARVAGIENEKLICDCMGLRRTC